jgi:hypothetical protein
MMNAEISAGRKSIRQPTAERTMNRLAAAVARAAIAQIGRAFVMRTQAGRP